MWITVQILDWAWRNFLSSQDWLWGIPVWVGSWFLYVFAVVIQQESIGLKLLMMTVYLIIGFWLSGLADQPQAFGTRVSQRVVLTLFWFPLIGSLLWLMLAVFFYTLWMTVGAGAFVVAFYVLIFEASIRLIFRL